MVQYTASFLKLYANISEMCNHVTDDDHELDHPEDDE
jgi:hypothetical protein